MHEIAGITVTVTELPNYGQNYGDPLIERVGNFAIFLGAEEDQQATRALRMARELR